MGRRQDGSEHAYFSVGISGTKSTRTNWQKHLKEIHRKEIPPLARNSIAAYPNRYSTYNANPVNYQPGNYLMPVPSPESNKPPQSKNALQGITLEALLVELHAQYGWEGLAKKVDINCFKQDPSIKSCLKFLRKTPWAREKVEAIYIHLNRANYE